MRRRQEEEDEYQRQLDMLGSVWSFGSGFAGQLGHGDLESSATPRIIKKLRGRSIAHVYAVRCLSPCGLVVLTGR
jgi:alpha-tubulin suppressor-like RCC1 family protein